MTQKEIISEIKAKGLPFNTQVFKLKIIDGNDGSSYNEYFFSKEGRDAEAEGVEYPYYFERSKIQFKESAFAINS